MQKGDSRTNNNGDAKPSLVAENVQSEYEGAVDGRVMQFIDEVAENGSKGVKPLDIGEINEAHVKILRNLTGNDYSDYKIVLPGDAIAHIQNRHGENGVADHSMADPKDIARIGWVINNFDSAEYTGITSWNYRNRNNTPAIVIMLQKRINGNYFVAEAVPDTNKKSIYIVAAYKKMQKNKALDCAL